MFGKPTRTMVMHIHEANLQKIQTIERESYDWV